MSVGGMRALVVVCLGVCVGLLWGCAGMEYAPTGKYFFYHQELPAAQRAVEAAKNAGKDKECPAEFQAAVKLKNEAYALYDACHTQEAIAKANEAISKANALCPRVEVPKPAPPAPAPAPAAPPAPTISFSSSPASIAKGSCSTLTWSASNATSASIDQGVGSVDTGGSKQVCPESTTSYTLTATGEGGSRTASTTVTVAAAPPAPIDRLTIHVNFDVDKSAIRKADLDELQKAVAFVKKYSGAKISVEGHTDSTGSEAYNQGLSERRAASVKEYLVTHGGVESDKIQSMGFGESRPIGDNKTAKGRFENRRVEILIVSR